MVSTPTCSNKNIRRPTKPVQIKVCVPPISALTLIFALSDPAFPATHHTTLVVGYAMAQTGNILIAVIFGVIAHFIGLIFGMVLNTDCGTHIDPPAVAIATCSFILFTLF